MTQKEDNPISKKEEEEPQGKNDDGDGVHHHHHHHHHHQEDHKQATKGNHDKKEQWGSQAEFFLATIGYSIGMGSLTRFPYVAMK